MTRPACRVLKKVLLLCLVAAPAWAMPGVDAAGNAVVSLVEDEAGACLIMQTKNQASIQSPSIAYLRGQDVSTILVADFPSLIWPFPSRTIYPQEKWIHSLHIGQFQADPPVLRLAISTDQPELLHNLDFHAAPGVLMIKWGRCRHAAKQQASAGTSRCQLRHEPAGAAPGQQAASGAAGTRAALSAPAPRLTLAGRGPLAFNLEAGRSFTYKSFRLHNPERAVIDLKGIPELSGTQIPQATPGSALKAIRLGHPDGDISICRLVFDLVGPDVPVTEEFNQDRYILSLAIGCQPSAGQGLKAAAASQSPGLAEELKAVSGQETGTGSGHEHVPGQENALDHVIKTAPAQDTVLAQGTASNQELRPIPGTTVVLDAGHGGSDPGAQRAAIQEKEITLEIASKVKTLLEQSGVRVLLTRGSDTSVSLEDRVALTNAIHPQAFLSVHINSLETNSSIHGIETYYQSEQSQQFARLIHKELVTNLEAPDRNVRRARFYVINHTSAPAVLAEVGFISNEEERAKLISSDYQNRVANALARGVILYLSRQSEETIRTVGIKSGKNAIDMANAQFTAGRDCSIRTQCANAN